MAVNDGAPRQDNESAAAEGASTNAGPPTQSALPHRAPPLWVVPLYVGGLVLVYLGERVLSTLEKGQWIATGLGVLCVLAATAVRFSPRFRTGGERRGIENLLAVLSALGAVGLVVYLATTTWGFEKLGLAAAELATQERVSGILSVVWISLIAVSVVPMLFAEAALYPMRHAERPESRRVRAAAASGLALALAGVYLCLFVFSAEELEVRADYSYFKTSRPSESTRKIAQSIKEPVRIVAFFPDVNEVRVEVARYLSELSAGLPNVKVQVTDRLLVPKLARDLYATQDGSIVIEKGTSKERLTLATEMKDARKQLKTLDKDFQEKLLKVARSRRTAYVTVGHGELTDTPKGRAAEEGRTSEIIRTLLQKQNYTVRDLGLAQGLGREVPEDAGIVLVLGPSEPFAAEEIASLKSYVERGGHLMLALDPDVIPSNSSLELVTDVQAGQGAPANPADGVGSSKTAGTPGSEIVPVSAPEQAMSGADAALVKSLQSLAEIVGLKFEPTILAHERQHVRRRFNPSDRAMLVTSSFSSHASVSTLSRNAPRAAVVVSGAGSLERIEGAPGKADFAVRAMGGTFADKNRNFRQDADERTAVMNLAAAITKAVGESKPESDKDKADKDKADKDKADKDKADKDKKDQLPEETRVFAIADADAFSDLVLSNMVANQVLFLDAVRWLGGEESFAGEIKSEEDVRIEHTKKEDIVWFYATIFGAPMLVLVLGLTISRSARRRAGGKR
jgi:hypothetical protein